MGFVVTQGSTAVTAPGIEVSQSTAAKAAALQIDHNSTSGSGNSYGIFVNQTVLKRCLLYELRRATRV